MDYALQFNSCLISIKYTICKNKTLKYSPQNSFDRTNTVKKLSFATRSPKSNFKDHSNHLQIWPSIKVRKGKLFCKYHNNCHISFVAKCFCFKMKENYYKNETLIKGTTVIITWNWEKFRNKIAFVPNEPFWIRFSVV